MQIRIINQFSARIAQFRGNIDVFGAKKTVFMVDCQFLVLLSEQIFHRFAENLVEAVVVFVMEILVKFPAPAACPEYEGVLVAI